MADGEQLDLLKVNVEAEAPVDNSAVVVKVNDDPVKDLAAQYKELEAKAAEQEARIAETEKREADARREAAAARQEAQTARTQATASDLHTITTALEASQDAEKAALRDLRMAKEAGDLDAEMEAQDRLTTAKLNVRTYDEAKATLEARFKTRADRPSDPVEAYIQGRSEQTASWLRAHRDYVTDPRKNSKLTAAHHDAVAEGYAPDTPGYFTHVEKFVGIKKADTKEVTEGDNVQRPGARRAAPPVAPVGGSGRTGSVTSSEVSLSRSEAAAATDGTHVWNYDDPSGQKRFRKGDPIGIQEFARRKRAMQASGQYDRSYETQ